MEMYKSLSSWSKFVQNVSSDDLLVLSFDAK